MRWQWWCVMFILTRHSCQCSVRAWYLRCIPLHYSSYSALCVSQEHIDILFALSYCGIKGDKENEPLEMGEDCCCFWCFHVSVKAAVAFDREVSALESWCGGLFASEAQCHGSCWSCCIEQEDWEDLGEDYMEDAAIIGCNKEAGVTGMLWAFVSWRIRNKEAEDGVFFGKEWEDGHGKDKNSSCLKETSPLYVAGACAA